MVPNVFGNSLNASALEGCDRPQRVRNTELLIREASPNRQYELHGLVRTCDIL
jgi:hypothetical protein